MKPYPYDGRQTLPFPTEDAILLSASVARKKDCATPQEQLDNTRFVQRSAPREVRDAIGHLCRFACSKRMRIVLPNDPEITPLVLFATRNFTNGGSHPDDPLVIVFESSWFDDKIPIATRRLGDWTCGCLVVTPARDTEESSLSLMRTLMVKLPRRAAFFIGGMDDVLAEHALTVKHNPKARRFALASTGSAASDLIDRGLEQHLPIKHPASSSSLLVMAELFRAMQIP
jgi:hypothetical protein